MSVSFHGAAASRFGRTFQPVLGCFVQNRVALENPHTIMIFTLIKCGLISCAFRFRIACSMKLSALSVSLFDPRTESDEINKAFCKTNRQPERRKSVIFALRFIFPPPLIPMLCLRTQFLIVNLQPRIAEKESSCAECCWLVIKIIKF